MRRCFHLLILLLLAARVHAAPLRLVYTLAPAPPRAGAEARTCIQVRLIGLNGQDSVRLQMPVWSPGDYHAQNHAQYVRSARAGTPDGEELPVAHPDPNTWEVETRGHGDLIFLYELPNTPAGLFSENVRVTARYAFYNGPATFMYVAGHRENPAVLEVEPPEGWKEVVSPLKPLPEGTGDPRAVRFSAPDYDTLADAPLLVGECATRQFDYAGRPHTLVFFGSIRGMDYDRFVAPLKKVVAEENRMMGGPPYDRYFFFLDIGNPGGGLEHRNSCRIGWSRNGSPAKLAAFAAHEFFHLWNVKSIRPVVLGPFDYIHPPRTRNLWFVEGVTSYYGNLTMRRAGLMTDAEYLENLSESIRQLQQTRARVRVTADEAGLRVWESGDSEGYGGLSYYLKGELIGLCLDLNIRERTGNRASLDDVMRDLLARYGLPKPGYPEDGLREAMIRAGGPELGPFYDLLCRSTEEMPFAECLGYAGLRLDRDYRVTTDPDAPPQARALRENWLTGRRKEAETRIRRQDTMGNKAIRRDLRERNAPPNDLIKQDAAVQARLSGQTEEIVQAGARLSSRCRS
jgi:predicted metalloprotease with PDZ domain